MKVSIIVPVYNVEKYVTACINSLVNQTYKDIEILVIDDGSKDGSIKEVEKFDDERIKILHKPNGGLSDARNYGMKYASGEYLCFVDSDDYVDLTLVEKCVDKINKYNSDIVCYDLAYILDNGERKNSPGANFEVSSYTTNKDIVRINNSACNKMIRTSFLKDKEFPKGIYYEDLAVIPYWVSLANNVSYVNEELYFYIQRGSSISHEISERIFDIYISLGMLKEKLERNVVNEMYVLQGLKLTTLRIKEGNDKKQRLSFYKKNIELLNRDCPEWYELAKRNAFSKEKIIYYLLHKGQYKIVDLIYRKGK